MGEAHYGNAMTEVALALAMAFFSIMILTMVSMRAAPEMAKAPGRQTHKGKVKRFEDRHNKPKFGRYLSNLSPG